MASGAGLVHKRGKKVKLSKFIPLIMLMLILKFFVVLPVLAGNNDSLPSHGYIGEAADGWSYTRHYSGMRLSIYWASNIDCFITGDNVIKIGYTADITKTGPRFKINSYTDLTIYDYMNRDNIGKGKSYDIKISDVDQYRWIGKGEVFNLYSQDIIDLMPDVWTGTKEQWDIWFEGGRDGEYKDYRNIPEIFKLCGAEITVDDFKNGIYVERNYRSEPGVYKIFLSRLLILL